MNEPVLYNLYTIIEDRKNNPADKSYTCYLFEQGIDKILKKLGEETSETIIAAKNNIKPDIVNESADLIYHLLVMLCDRGIPLGDLFSELENRAQKQGNLKEMKNTDKNS